MNSQPRWRFLSVALLVMSTVALADLGPPPARCAVPAECVTCTRHAGDPEDGGCGAGLTKSSCSDRSGSQFTEYFCPPGKQATRGGCSSAPGLGLMSLLALVPLLRRRR